MAFFVMLVKGQNYTQTVGVRGGLTSGITYRNHVNESLANEFILKMRRNEMNLTFLRVFYEPNNFGYSPKLMVYKGYGAHIGYRYDDRYTLLLREFVYSKETFYPVLGFDVYLGAEYRIEEFPFIVGIDCKPFFEFSTRQIFRIYLPDIAFAIKYRF